MEPGAVKPNAVERPEARVHGAGAAVIVASGLGLVFLGLGITGQGVGFYPLAACHALVAVGAPIAARATDKIVGEQIMAGLAALTAFVAGLVLPPRLTLLVPIGFFGPILIGGQLRRGRTWLLWLGGGSGAYMLSMVLRDRLGLVLDDVGAVGAAVVLLAPPAFFAGYLARLRSITTAYRESMAQEEQAKAELAGAKRQAEGHSSAKSHFLANMSHELRTPLNAIIGYSEMMLEDARDEGRDELAGDLEKVHNAGKHLVALVSDVLDISKIEAGKMALELRTYDVDELLRDVKVTAESLADKRGNRFVFKAASIGEATGDVTKLRQILDNLIGNACKFTEEGTVTLEAEAVGGDLRFRVVDDGIGMSPGQLERVFEPFTQAEDSTARRFGGTGLGLTLTRRFCELMGGEVAVTSTEGEGSTFTVTIPRQVAPLT